jgi:hypothetical protein
MLVHKIRKDGTGFPNKLIAVLKDRQLPKGVHSQQARIIWSIRHRAQGDDIEGNTHFFKEPDNLKVSHPTFTKNCAAH